MKKLTEEQIKEAWGVHYESVKDNLDEDGWYKEDIFSTQWTSDKFNFIKLIEYNRANVGNEIFVELGADEKGYADLQHFRPHTLFAIQNTYGTPTKEDLQKFMDHPEEIEDVIQAFTDDTVEWLPYRIVMNLIENKLWKE